MSELVMQSGAQEQQERKRDTRTFVERIAMVATAAAVLTVPVAKAVHLQDRYSPSRIAFSEFMGCEDWDVVSSARTDEVFKVIVANLAMTKAYKAGTPGSGQPLHRYQKR
jgi:hypothetical protein